LVPIIDLVANARFACYLPLVVLVLGQITSYLDRQTQNQHPSEMYWLFLGIWNIAHFALPVLGIAWGVVAWKSTAGKLAALINILFLILLMYPHRFPLAF